MLRAKFCEPSQSFSRPSNEADWGPPSGPAAQGNEPAKLKAIAAALRTCDDVILATDCDREGQLIGQEILDHLGYRGRVRRALCVRFVRRRWRASKRTAPRLLGDPERLFGLNGNRWAEPRQCRIGQAWAIAHERSYAGVNAFGSNRAAELAQAADGQARGGDRDAIRDVTKRNDLVLYPFSGSGTTLIAAKKTGKRARAVEIDCHCCDLAIRRWEVFTGKAAVLSATGETFEEVAE